MKGVAGMKLAEVAVTKAVDVVPVTKPPSSPAITPPLSSNATLLAGSFVSGLKMKDPRFNLASFGTFLPEIPGRLGSHRILDASASALISAYPSVFNRQPSHEALTKYGRALCVVRLSLDDPKSDGIVETLCAIYFLFICQAWTARPTDKLVSHGKAISQMLNAVVGKLSTHQVKEGFERQVLVTMCMVVVSIPILA
jgi:hypothetical protein